MLYSTFSRSLLVSFFTVVSILYISVTAVSAQCEGTYFKITGRTITDTQTYLSYRVWEKARDMNGDGKIDLVATNVNSPVNFNKLFIYPGNGAGGFGTRTEISLPSPLFEDSSSELGRSYELGDFNSDGKNDLIVQMTQGVTVYLNNGTGAFSPMPTSTALSGGEEIKRLADINGDARPDLITFARSRSIAMAYRLGNADGTFGAPVVLSYIYLFQRNEGDFDGDGDLDFAIVNRSGTNYALQIYFNQGNGVFTPGSTLTALDSRNYDLSTVADFNNDGKPDVVFGTSSVLPSKTIVLINQGNNTFASSIYTLPDGISSFPAVGDFDGDGDVDLFHYNGRDGSSYVLNTNNGAGNFAQRLYPVGAPLIGLPVGDLNGDGKADFIQVNNNNRGFDNNNAGIFNETTFFSKLSVCNNFGQTKIVDFDGNAKTDLTLWRPSDGRWRTATRTFNWGASTDKLVPGDYDGDGKTDYAVFRPSNGVWYVVNSSNNSTFGVQFGSNTDKPVPADYNGDGKTDFAVYRPSNGVWYVLTSGSNQFSAVQFGIAEDAPLPEDYDGDEKADVAVFRPSSGTWYIRRSSDGGFSGIAWGLSTDKPYPADYDGDGKADICVRRESNNYWYILRSYNNQSGAFPYGVSSDIAQTGDYDGNGIMDIGVYRPDTRFWYSTGAIGAIGGQFGEVNEIPTASLSRF